MGNRQTTQTQQTQNQTQNQAFNTQNQYGWQTPPDTADIQALRGTQFQIDPSIGYRIGGAIRRMQSSFNSPLGGYYTPGMRAAIERGQERELMQQGGQQTREGIYDVNNQNYARNLAVAGMTAPRLTQTGSSGQSSGTVSGTSSGTSQTSEPWYNGAIQGGASIGSALLL